MTFFVCPHLQRPAYKQPGLTYSTWLTYLNVLPLARPERLVRLRVGGQDLRAGELVGDALGERRQLLELQAAVNELFVLQRGEES